MPEEPDAEAGQDDAEPFEQHEAEWRVQNDGRGGAADEGPHDAVWAEQQAERRRQEVLDADERAVLQEGRELHRQVRDEIDACRAEYEKQMLAVLMVIHGRPSALRTARP